MIPNHQKYSTEYIKLQLERFADQIDNQIQNKLMTEIMIKYSQLSKQFESKNKLLVKAENRLLKYNIELEEIVNKKGSRNIRITDCNYLCTC